MFRLVLTLFALLIVLGADGTSVTLPSLEGGSAWLNSLALRSPDLQGKIVLIDFWEYTCLNCLRTLPYLEEWNKRYHDRLTIVGVHTPEFGFSGGARAVESNAKRLGVTWPIVLDDERKIWNRFGVKVWPTEFLADQNGKVVSVHVGEGGYQETEAQIQKLIRDREPKAALPQPMALLPQDSYAKPGAVCYPQTPEILVEASPIADAPRFGDPKTDLQYTDRGNHRDGSMYLNGYWSATKEAVVFGGGPGYFVLSYHAIEVAAVMTRSTTPIRVDVEQDGAPIAKESAGSDVRYDDKTSYIIVDEPRAYHLLMNKRFGQHELQLLPQARGLSIYDIAFESCEVPRN